MRIDIQSVHVELTPALRRYAESRAWLAAQRHLPRVTWVGVWLIGQRAGADAAPRPVSCRIDAWLRGAGHSTVHHTDDNAYAAIDVAAAQLGQAIPRTLRHAAKRRRRRLLDAAAGPRGGDDRPAGDGRSRPVPRLAAVIERRDPARRRLPLLPWLRARYGIELVSRHALPQHAWDAAAAPAARTPAAGVRYTLADRIAPALACRPDLVVVVGRPGPDGATADTRDHVRRIARHIRPLVAPVQTKAIWADERLWLNERWEPECHLESHELDCAPEKDDDHNYHPAAAPPTAAGSLGRDLPSRRPGDATGRAAPAGAFVDFDPVLPDWRSDATAATVTGLPRQNGGDPWSPPAV